MQIIVARTQLTKALQQQSRERFLVVSVEALRIGAIQPLTSYIRKVAIDGENQLVEKSCTKRTLDRVPSEPIRVPSEPAVSKTPLPERLSTPSRRAVH
jgi:hypothetical protein